MRKILYIVLAAVLCGCTNSRTDTNDKTTEVMDAPVELPSHELTLPVVPDSLERPSQRADYMMLHFWDGMDFNDRTMTQDTLLVEQTFSNFIEILPYTSSVDAAEKAVNRLFELASVDKDAYRHIASVSDKYLYDSDSPFKNHVLYRYFVAAILRGKILNEAETSHYKAQYDEISNQQN